jgi:hypothetical protein
MKVTDKSYQNHRVFSELKQYSDFYDSLAMSVFHFSSMGTKAICNIDTYIFSSIQGTIESIRTVLAAGRINDAYALLRKYYDSAIINVYSNLYLKDHFSLENLIVEKINKWLQGKDKLPTYRVMSQYIRDSIKLAPINVLLNSDERYNTLRGRCNDHTHYNFFHNFLLNDKAVYLEDRLQHLTCFSRDARDILILHLAFVFFLMDHYLMSSDYMDSLECNMEPEKDSSYWVAPFAQKIFDEIVTKERPDIAAVIKGNTAMQLE